MQNCTCELSVINQDKAIPVHMQRFGQKKSSSPSAYGCGLLLRFGIRSHYRVWEAQCVVGNSVILNSIPINDTMTITSITVNGTLNDNEGYCIEIKKAVSDKSGNQLELKCGNGSTITTNTTQSAEKTTKMTLTTVPTTTTTTTTTIPTKTVPTTTTTTVPPPTTKVPTTTTTTIPTTTVPTTTTTTVPKTTKTTAIDTIEFEILNFTSTDGSITTNQANEPKNKDDDDTTALAVGASVGGFVTIIVVIAVICIYRRYQEQKVTIQDYVYSVPDKKRVKHVTAPGEHGCEYAVVRKPNKSNFDKSEDQSSTSNVYAVVEKKKRMSDGKGTNQKRDSLKAENDEETGQS
ncbi:unnamed protein product [Mytilus coruscus]|uniref:Uncharacterized protein n=1 Tax=Mytilus coruscus TaxID=42192 RepID=A0A6J8F382_MYTCO|nr:unnamed protein product [Mytilus coruscus]